MLAALIAAWVQFAADDRAHVRTIAAGAVACPVASVDGRGVPLRRRAAPEPGTFDDTVCDAPLPVNARTLRVAGRSLPVPSAHLRTVVVIGDTGCRVKGFVSQSCDDPGRWPFATIARDVAAVRPDVVVHVGDYYYRETACPVFQFGCKGTPHGDAWPAWNADWFAPAAPIFAAAPLVLVRGNHESCKRGGHGWFRYLDPRAMTGCEGRTAPYAVSRDGMRFVVFDDAEAEDGRPNADAYDAFREELHDARALARPGAWFVAHRPPITNGTLVATSEPADYAGYTALISGHIHTFAAYDVAGGPPQVVNGTGGDLLDRFENVAKLARDAGTAIGDGVEDPRFGYAVYRRRGATAWTLEQHAVDGSIVRRCTLGGGTVRCG